MGVARSATRRRAVKTTPSHAHTQSNHRIASRPATRPPTTTFTGPERALHQRLAAVDRMRDRALESGDVNMLDRADRLEGMAREQYAHMIAQRNRPADTVSSVVVPDVEARTGQFRAPDSHEHGEHEVPGFAGHPGSTGNAFGQAISEQARTSGREFGQFTAQQAREYGREFGQSNADKTRLLAPPVALPPVDATPLPAPTESP